MSELITVNPGTPSTGPILGLNIINEQPVQIFRETAVSPIIVTGSAGRDVIQVAAAENTASYRINAGAGNDEVTGGAGPDVIAGDEGNDRIAGGFSDDVIIGGPGDDDLQGGDGLDVLIGGPGDDTLRGERGNDTLLGGPGNDRLFGGDNEDQLRGGNGRDILSGGDGNDSIRGGAGNDLLIPGAGRDVMRGGFGNDTFRFDTSSTGLSEIDRIIDFRADDDTIELSRRLLPGSGLQRGELGSEDFAIVEDLNIETAEAVLVYEQKSGIVYYNPANGRDVPLFQLQANLSDISASNFTIL